MMVMMMMMMDPKLGVIDDVTTWHRPNELPAQLFGFWELLLSNTASGVRVTHATDDWSGWCC